MNPLDAQCNRQRNDAICVSQLKNALEIDRGILAEKPDVKIFLPFRFFVYRAEDLFQPNTYNRFLGKHQNQNILDQLCVRLTRIISSGSNWRSCHLAYR